MGERTGTVGETVRTVGETSSDINKNMHRVNINPKVFEMGFMLLASTKSGDNAHMYKDHPLGKGLTYSIIESKVESYSFEPDPNNEKQKWQVNVIPKDEFDEPPKITAEMMKYDTRMYAGKKIFIHPEHLEFSQKVFDEGESVKYRFGFIFVPGKGVISFLVNQK